MRTKMAISIILTVGLVSAIIFIEPAYSFEKEEMDAALREEIAKIDDIEMKRAMLEEYKEILIEQMPELEMEDRTCLPCEDDIEMSELARVELNNMLLDSEAFSNESESLLEKETLYETTTEIMTETIVVGQEWVPSECGCGGSLEDVTKEVTTEVTTTVAVGETVVEAN